MVLKIRKILKSLFFKNIGIKNIYENLRLRKIDFLYTIVYSYFSI